MAGDPAKMKVLEQELEKMKASIAAEMQFGDEVYLLQFKANGRIYDYYAVCRPANCQVLPFDTLRSITRRWSEIKEW
jgi:hypothetical protein